MAYDEEEAPMMRFEIHEEDVDDEFQPGFSAGRKRKFTKEDAIYGIWNDEDGEPEDRSIFSGKRKKRAAKRPVSFVTSQSTKEDDTGTPPPTAMDVDGDKTPERGGDETPERVVPDLRGGLGFRGAESKPKVKQFKQKLSRSEVAEIGKFEQYSKGVASKMMEKMGWVKGEGIGKKGGIARPVEVKSRPKNMGIGYGGFKEKTKQAQMDFPQGEPDSDEEVAELKQELKDIDVARGIWRKDGVVGGAPKGKKRAPKKEVVYKTVEEVSRMPQKQVIIDMTSASGPRKITSFDQVKGGFGDDEPDPDQKLPELQYNLKMIVDYTEMEIQKINDQLKRQTRALDALTLEKEELEGAVAREGSAADRLDTVVEVLEVLQKKRFANDPKDVLTVEAIEEAFATLQKTCYDEYRTYRVAEMAEPLLFPLLTSEIAVWDPFAPPLPPDPPPSGRKGLPPMSPTRHVDPQVFFRWRKLLECDPSEGTCMYTRMIEKVWMPRVRTAICNEWDPRECGPCVDLLEAWEPALPTVLFQYILHHLVLPKINSAVDHWNPRTDVVRIHTWLHPWLPMLGDALQPVFPTISHKLSVALTAWHPSDPSAHAMLLPWVEVFDPQQLDGLLVRCILPKLAQTLREFVINPSNQTLEPFQAVMQWRDIIPVHHFVTLMDSEFFPKWGHVLFSWLSCSNPPPNYDEITQWYLGWKGMFDEELLAQDRIRHHFTHALDMVNRAIADRANMGAYVPPGTVENMSYFRVTEKEKLASAARPPPPVPAATFRTGGTMAKEAAAATAKSKISRASTSFKEQVEQFAAEHDVLMMPLNKSFDGKKIYMFGDAKIYIDSVKELVFVEYNKMWNLVDLEELLLLAVPE